MNCLLLLFPQCLIDVEIRKFFLAALGKSFDFSVLKMILIKDWRSKKMVLAAWLDESIFQKNKINAKENSFSPIF